MRGGVDGRGVKDARYGGGVFGKARLGLSPGRRLISVAQESFFGGGFPGMAMAVRFIARGEFLDCNLRLLKVWPRIGLVGVGKPRAEA